MSITPQGVVQRDEAVWQLARRLRAPILMLLSGGYTRASAGVIVDSLTSILTGLAQHSQQEAAAAAAAPAGS